MSDIYSVLKDETEPWLRGKNRLVRQHREISRINDHFKDLFDLIIDENDEFIFLGKNENEDCSIRIYHDRNSKYYLPPNEYYYVVFELYEEDDEDQEFGVRMERIPLDKLFETVTHIVDSDFRFKYGF